METANNTGTVLSFNTQEQAWVMETAISGDLATDIVFDVWNDTTGDETTLTRADIPPGGAVIIAAGGRHR